VALPFTDAVEAAVYEGARLLLAHRPIDDVQYEMLTAALSTAALVELIALVGYYDLLAALIATFRIGVPEESSPDP
jgi:hypothetical protein